MQVDFVTETIAKVDCRVSLNALRNLPNIVQRDLAHRLIEQKIDSHSATLNTLVFPVIFLFDHIQEKQCSTTYIFVPGEQSQYRECEIPDSLQLQGEMQSQEADPDYQQLAELYLSKGLASLQSAILNWLAENDFTDESGKYIDRLNQISAAVFEIASKQSQILASSDLKMAGFTLNVPFEPADYYSHQPVQAHLPLAKEAMSLLNTGFFDKAITELINYEGDAVRTLRRCAVVLYVGANANLEIFDAACALATWKPFKVVNYVGEQRNSLSLFIEKVFQPLTEKIQDFCVKQKRADKFPCLTLLCVAQNKVTGDLCEFRRHFTAQSGGQLVIPGFSNGTDSVLNVVTPMNIAGEPQNIPVIRGFNS